MNMATETERLIELPASAAAAGLARRELSTTPGISAELGYKALLLTSELIAVYLDGSEPDPAATLRLAISVRRDRIRIEVGGRAPGISPEAFTDETPSLGGLGLRIVERMADDWGIEGVNDSTTWFELSRG